MQMYKLKSGVNPDFNQYGTDNIDGGGPKLQDDQSVYIAMSQAQNTQGGTALNYSHIDAGAETCQCKRLNEINGDNKLSCNLCKNDQKSQLLRSKTLHGSYKKLMVPKQHGKGNSSQAILKQIHKQALLKKQI